MLLLYGIFSWGVAHLSVTKGFFATDGSPNYGVFVLSGVVFMLRWAVLFAVPAHLAYRTAELLLSLALRFKKPPG